MGLKSSFKGDCKGNQCDDQIVDKNIGTSYDVVREVYDWLPWFEENWDTIENVYQYWEDIGQWYDEIVVMYGEIETWYEEIGVMHDEIQGWHSDVEGWHSDVEGWHSDVEGWWHDIGGDDGTGETNGWRKEVKDWHADVDGWQQQVSNDKDAAAQSAADADQSAQDADASAQAASQSEDNAAISESNAAVSESNASASEYNAEVSEANALESENNAAQSESNAAASESAAASSASAAATSESNAETSAQNAATSESNAAASEASAASSESNAAQSEINAATSEYNAAQSESNAETSAIAAANSETAAAASADAAAASESNASDSEIAAASSEANAAASEQNAANSASAAASSESNAADSEANAAASESAAATSEYNAGESETAAGFYESQASSHSTTAQNSATSAGVSEGNAANSETNAASSAADAQYYSEHSYFDQGGHDAQTGYPATPSQSSVWYITNGGNIGGVDFDVSDELKYNIHEDVWYKISGEGVSGGGDPQPVEVLEDVIIQSDKAYTFRTSASTVEDGLSMTASQEVLVGDATTTTTVGIVSPSTKPQHVKSLDGSNEIDEAYDFVTVEEGQVVRESRNILAGDGLNGSSDLSSDVTLSVDSSVVRNSRTITGGDGLTGGGDLSTDQVLCVDSTVIRTSGTQTIGGAKTFSTVPVTTAAQGSSADELTKKDYVDTCHSSLSTNKADKTTNLVAGDGLTGGGTLAADRTLCVDSSVVRTSGNQSISGTKTFTSQLILCHSGNAAVQRFETNCNNKCWYVVNNGTDLSIREDTTGGTGNIQFQAGGNAYFACGATSGKNPTGISDLTRKDYVDGCVDCLTTKDGQNVKLTGNQTIAGEKTFSNHLKASSYICAERFVGTNGVAGIFSSSGNLPIYLRPAGPAVSNCQIVIATDGNVCQIASQGANADYLTKRSFVDTCIDCLNTKDDENVKLTGAQTICGAKTFIESIRQCAGYRLEATCTNVNNYLYSVDRSSNNDDLFLGMYPTAGGFSTIYRVNSSNGVISFHQGAKSLQAPTVCSDLTRKDYVDGLDGENVKLTGSQCIEGYKCFNNGASQAVRIGGTAPTPMMLCRDSEVNINMSFHSPTQCRYFGTTGGVFAFGTEAALSTTTNRYATISADGVFQTSSQSTCTNSLTRKDYVDGCLGTKANTSTNMAAGDGLSGGGTLAANRTFCVNSTVLRTTGNQTKSGNLTVTTSCATDRFIGGNAAGAILASSANGRSVLLRPNGSTCTTGQLCVSTAGNVTARRFLVTDVQGTGANALTRKDYVDGSSRFSCSTGLQCVTLANPITCYPYISILLQPAMWSFNGCHMTSGHPHIFVGRCVTVMSGSDGAVACAISVITSADGRTICSSTSTSKILCIIA